MAMNRRAALGSALGLPGVASMLPSGEGKGSYSVSAQVFREGETVVAVARDGQVIAHRPSQGSTASAIQAAIDFVHPGGEIKIAAGRYRLEKSLVLYDSSTLVGEGRQTILIPPADDYGLKIVRTSKSQIIRDRLLPELDPRLIGVKIWNLALDGEGAGKGIYLENISGAALQSIWIARTGGGSGLYLGPSVMESVFEDIHMLANGNAEKQAPAVVISSQPDGDASNNLHFDKFFVIYPNHIAFSVGGPGARHPRLIFISHAMFHGWLPLPKPYDLIRIVHLDYRGLVLQQSRLGNGGHDSALLRVEQGDVKVTDNVIGGGSGKYAILGEAEATLTITGNTIHGSNDLPDIYRQTPNYDPQQSFLVLLRGTQATFKDNIVMEGASGLRLSPGFNCLVTGNRFSTVAGWPLVSIGDDGERGSRNIVVSGNIFAAKDRAGAIAVSTLSTSDVYVRDNLFDSARA